MLILDRYAYSNRLRSVNPVYKAGISLLVSGLCLLLNRPAVGILAALWMVGLAAGTAGIPPRVMVRLLLLETVFFIMAVVGILINIGTAPATNAWWQQSVGGLWIIITPDRLQTTVIVLGRAMGSTAAMNFLALTTPMMDLIDLLRRCRVPLYLIDIIALMYRYIFILLVTAQQMRTAQTSRLGYSSLRHSFRSSGLLVSQLFIHAYKHSRRMEVALYSRGYNGRMNVLSHDYDNRRHLLLWSVPIVLTLLGAWWWL